MNIWIKRLVMFALVNVLVMITISFLFSFFGFGASNYYQGASIDYGSIMLMSLIVGFSGSIFSLLISRAMAKWTMGVKVIDPQTASPDEKALVEMVRRFTTEAEIPMPEVGIYDSPEMNAFATGPTKSRSLVAVSTGLLRQMNRNEVEGVIAHEVAHIANGDMVTMTLIQGVVNTFVVAISWILSIVISNALRSNDDRSGGSSSPFLRHGIRILCEIVLGILGVIAVNAFSRWREYRADAGGAELGGKDKMIAALKALQARFEPADARGDASLSTMKIAHPGGMMALFMTHPPLQKRIEALERGNVKSGLQDRTMMAAGPNGARSRQDRSL